MCTTGHPFGLGMVHSISRPGGNRQPGGGYFVHNAHERKDVEDSLRREQRGFDGQSQDSLEGRAAFPPAAH